MLQTRMKKSSVPLSTGLYTGTDTRSTRASELKQIMDTYTTLKNEVSKHSKPEKVQVVRLRGVRRKQNPDSVKNK